jgi:hypothetical protein
MRKRTSKRRWLARFKLGKPLPATALAEYPDLRRRLGQFEHAADVYGDLIRKA